MPNPPFGGIIPASLGQQTSEQERNMKPVTFALLLALTAMAFAVAEEPKTSADEPAKDIEKVLDAADAPRSPAAAAQGVGEV